MFNINEKQSCVTLEGLLDLLGESEQLALPFSRGGCVCHSVKHPKFGLLTLIETPMSSECIVLVN